MISVKEFLLLIFRADASRIVSDQFSAEVPGVPGRVIVAAMICPTFFFTSNRVFDESMEISTFPFRTTVRFGPFIQNS